MHGVLRRQLYGRDWAFCPVQAYLSRWGLFCIRSLQSQVSIWPASFRALRLCNSWGHRNPEVLNSEPPREDSLAANPVACRVRPATPADWALVALALAQKRSNVWLWSAEACNTTPQSSRVCMFLACEAIPEHQTQSREFTKSKLRERLVYQRNVQLFQLRTPGWCSKGSRGSLYPSCCTGCTYICHLDPQTIWI